VSGMVFMAIGIAQLYDLFFTLLPISRNAAPVVCWDNWQLIQRPVICLRDQEESVTDQHSAVNLSTLAVTPLVRLVKRFPRDKMILTLGALINQSRRQSQRRSHGRSHEQSHG